VRAEIAIVLDPSGTAAYTAGRIDVGELLAEVADEGRNVMVSAASLIETYATLDAAEDIAMLGILAAAAVCAPVEASGDRSAMRAVGRIMRLERERGLATAHSLYLALQHDAIYVTDRGDLDPLANRLGIKLVQLSEGSP
jgi:hypothetical protein